MVNYMHMVDDIEKFNRYPWGRVAFDFLEKLMYILADNIKGQIGKTPRPSTDVCGFSIAL